MKEYVRKGRPKNVIDVTVEEGLIEIDDKEGKERILYIFENPYFIRVM